MEDLSFSSFELNDPTGEMVRYMTYIPSDTAIRILQSYALTYHIGTGFTTHDPVFEIHLAERLSSKSSLELITTIQTLNTRYYSKLISDSNTSQNNKPSLR